VLQYFYHLHSGTMIIFICMKMHLLICFVLILFHTLIEHMSFITEISVSNIKYIKWLAIEVTVSYNKHINHYFNSIHHHRDYYLSVVINFPVKKKAKGNFQDSMTSAIPLHTLQSSHEEPTHSSSLLTLGDTESATQTISCRNNNMMCWAMHCHWPTQVLFPLPW